MGIHGMVLFAGRNGFGGISASSLTPTMLHLEVSTPLLRFFFPPQTPHLTETQLKIVPFKVRWHPYPVQLRPLWRHFIRIMCFISEVMGRSIVYIIETIAPFAIAMRASMKKKMKEKMKGNKKGMKGMVQGKRKRKETTTTTIIERISDEERNGD